MISLILLEKALFNSGNDEFHVKVARTLDEACDLIKAGFEKVDEMDGVHIYRKRKISNDKGKKVAIGLNSG